MALLWKGQPPTASLQRVLGEQETKEGVPADRGPTSDPSSASAGSPALLTQPDVDIAQDPSLSPGSAGCISFSSSSVTPETVPGLLRAVASGKGRRGRKLGEVPIHLLLSSRRGDLARWN